ncbi:MAG: DUF3307 domain-containing protein [Bacteroidota bacterium]
MTIIILKLVLAHLIGDFFIQHRKWVAHKEKKKHKCNVNDDMYI